MKIRNRSIIVIALAAIVAAHAILIRHYYFVCDDAFISLRYLANWLAGHGLVYNPGERVEGFTNLGWIIALAPFVRAGLRAEVVAPAISIAFSFALLALVAAFPLLTREPEADRNDPRLWATGLSAAFLLAANRSYNVWATSGLETRMFSFLAFAALILVIRALRTRRAWELPAAGVVFALAELTRPETMLLAATAFTLLFAATLALKTGRSLRSLAAGPAMCAALIAAHLVWRHAYYGDWLPNTYYVKTGHLHLALGLRYLSLFGFEYLYWVWLGPAAWLIVRSLRRRDPVPAFLAAYAAPYLGYLLVLGGDHFEYRFLDPLLPLFAIICARAAVELTLAATRPAIRTATVIALLVLSFYHIVFPLVTETRPPVQYFGVRDLKPNPTLALLSRLPPLPAMLKWYDAAYYPMIDNLAGVRWEDHRYLAAGLVREAAMLDDWIERGYLPRSERLCIQTAGIIPYYTRMPALDYFGLTNATVAHLRPAKHVRLFHTKQAPISLMREWGVDYIYLEISPRGPGDDPIAGRSPVRLNDDEVEMLGKDNAGRAAVLLACSPDSCLLFATPGPADEVLARLSGRGLAVAAYAPGPDGLFYRRGP